MIQQKLVDPVRRDGIGVGIALVVAANAKASSVVVLLLPLLQTCETNGGSCTAGRRGRRLLPALPLLDRGGGELVVVAEVEHLASAADATAQVVLAKDEAHAVLVDNLVGRLLGRRALFTLLTTATATTPAAIAATTAQTIPTAGGVHGLAGNFGPEQKSPLAEGLLQRQARIGQFGNDGPFHARIGLAPPLRSLGLEEDGQGRRGAVDGGTCTEAETC
mmetsp:Transcript_2002/g.3368  ORF Transcript_2002/g.3368 Transcript_2002/m.3368 type:complete len:219 (+) Transcript_2002:205-861(+)